MAFNVDGNQSLGDQQNALNGFELANFVKTTKYVKQTGGAPTSRINVATTEDAPPGHQSLVLVAIDAGADPSTAAQPAGKTQVFSGTAFVSGVEKTVVGFR